PLRNLVIVLLSFKAGLRAKEVACITWSMLTDTEGQLLDHLSLSNGASKGNSGRVIPLHPLLKAALEDLYAYEKSYKKRNGPRDFVITLQRSLDPGTRSYSVRSLLKDWYSKLGFVGASSHTGRRTFITRAARTIGEVGGSLRDVQAL